MVSCFLGGKNSKVFLFYGYLLEMFFHNRSGMINFVPNFEELNSAIIEE